MCRDEGPDESMGLSPSQRSAVEDGAEVGHARLAHLFGRKLSNKQARRSTERSGMECNGSHHDSVTS